MTSKTHVALGLLIGLATLKYFPNMDTYITISGACIGSLIPDLDTKKSDPSQIFPPVSYLVDKVTKHRGATHATFPFLLIIAYLYFKSIPCLMMGIGSLSHTLIDEITMKLEIRCMSMGESVIYYVLWTLNVAVIINLVAIKYNL